MLRTNLKPEFFQHSQFLRNLFPKIESVKKQSIVPPRNIHEFLSHPSYLSHLGPTDFFLFLIAGQKKISSNEVIDEIEAYFEELARTLGKVNRPKMRLHSNIKKKYICLVRNMRFQFQSDCFLIHPHI